MIAHSSGDFSDKNIHNHRLYTKKYIFVKKKLFYVKKLLFHKLTGCKNTAFLHKIYFCKKAAFLCKKSVFLQKFIRGDSARKGYLFREKWYMKG